MADVFSKEKRSEVMSRIKSKWTEPERIMHGYLKSMKVKHEMHPKLAGNPDIFLKGRDTLVFIDGDFWHGKHFSKRKAKLGAFWKSKIQTNMRRDRRHNTMLRAQGWTVIRLWEEDIMKRPEWCIKQLNA